MHVIKSKQQYQYTINTLISAELIHACIIFQLAEVVDMFTSTGDNSLRAITYQVRQQQQRLVTNIIHFI